MSENSSLTLSQKQLDEGSKLYREGRSFLSRALENTQYTHIHSEDIRSAVLSEYYIPAAKPDYPPAIEKVAKYYLLKGNKSAAYQWIERYKKITNSSNTKLMMLFGPAVGTYFWIKSRFQ